MEIRLPASVSKHRPSAATARRPYTPWITLTLAVAGLLWLWATPLVFVTRLENGEWLASSYSLAEDKPDHPRLRLLREREKLLDVIAPGRTEMEKIVLLRHWAHSQWDFKGAAFAYPAWDAVEILDLARTQNNRGFCAQYAIVLLQACQAVGLHARYVELPGHFVVGVWSSERNNWVVMDPLNDIHFEHDGLPMTGRQLCHAYWSDDLKGVERVSFGGKRDPATREDLKVYRMFSIVTAADQLTHPIQIQINGAQPRELVRESDPRKYPVIGRDRVGFSTLYLAWKEAGAREKFKDMPESDDRDDFRYRMNQSFIFLARRYPEKGLVKLILWPENAPTFRDFEVSVDGGEFHKVPSKELFWPLHPGVNDVSAQARLEHDWVSRPSTCRIFYKPAWWGLRAPPKPDNLPPAAF